MDARLPWYDQLKVSQISQDFVNNNTDGFGGGGGGNKDSRLNPRSIPEKLSVFELWVVKKFPELYVAY